MKTKRYETARAFAFIFTCSFLVSCTDFLEVGAPRNRVVTQTVYDDDALADAAVVGIYSEMFNASGFAGGGVGSVTALAGLSADELVYQGTDAGLQAFASNAVQSVTANNLNVWTSAYKTIYRANDVIEGLTASAGVAKAISDRLMGEALFIRGFSHFYLTNLYGAVPLALTADYRVTRSLPREPEERIYEQVGRDLLQAYELLPEDYGFVDNERIRPTRWAAAALLARVYLYQKRWEDAIEKAGEVIRHESLYRLSEEPLDVFQKNSPEAIWQLLPFNTSRDTYEAFYAIPVASSQAPPAYTLTDALLSQFGEGDARKQAWIGWFVPVNDPTNYPYPYKYKIRQTAVSGVHHEYSMILRLAEQYLIRAEAHAEMGDFDIAKADVDLLRAAHGRLSGIVANSKADILAAIEKERMIEFFYEWGHRWLDLKRWGRADKVLVPIKPNWRAEAGLWPIPQSELEANPSLGQNPGYSR